MEGPPCRRGSKLGSTYVHCQYKEDVPLILAAMKYNFVIGSMVPTQHLIAKYLWKRYCGKGMMVLEKYLLCLERT